MIFKGMKAINPFGIQKREGIFCGLHVFVVSEIGYIDTETLMHAKNIF